MLCVSYDYSGQQRICHPFLTASRRPVGESSLAVKHHSSCFSAVSIRSISKFRCQPSAAVKFTVSSLTVLPCRQQLSPSLTLGISVLNLLKKMRIVGLTGGIASGKSTVSNLFKSHGIPVVDADVIARDVLKKGTGGYKKVVATFGEDILQPSGDVDRTKLGQIVFSDPGKRQLLNRLLAPYISSGIFQEILKLWLKGSRVIVLDIPLLFEAKMDKWTKPIIVVWIDPETQLQRLMARDQSNEEDARNRINAQMSLDLKRTKADIVIDNTGSLEDLEKQFQKVLFQVTRPLTWTEFWLSRQGALMALVSIIIGVIVGKGISRL